MTRDGLTGLLNHTNLKERLAVEVARRGRFKQHVWGLYALSHWINRTLL
jgi:hypothetical protein